VGRIPLSRYYKGNYNGAYVFSRNFTDRFDEDAQFFIDWIDREIEFYRQERGFKQPEHRAEMLSFFEKARGVYSKLRGN